MSFTIPLQNLPAYTFEIALEGSTYRFGIIWNSRYEFWTIDIMDRQGNMLIGGIKMVINYELLYRYRRDDVPPGALMAIDTTGKLLKIGRDDLASAIKLVYFTADEVDGIIS